MGKEWLGLAPSLAPSSCLYFRATCLISWHAYQEQDNQGDDFVLYSVVIVLLLVVMVTMATILPIKQTLLDVLYFRLNLPKKQVFVKNTCFFIANLHYRVTAPKGGFLLSKKNYERKPSYLYHLIALGVRASLSTLHTRDGR